MSGHHLPQNIDPFKQFDARIALEGHIELKKLSRLDGLLSSNGGRVSVKLYFGRDEQGTAMLTGSLSACIHAVYSLLATFIFSFTSKKLMLNGYLQNFPFFALNVPTKGKIIFSNMSNPSVNSPIITDAKITLQMV